MRAPVSVVVTMVVQALLLLGAVGEGFLYITTRDPIEMFVAGVIVLFSGVCLFGLLRRRHWARVVNALYLGSTAAVGWTAFLMIGFRNQRLGRTWPLWACIAVITYLASVLAFGRPEKRYFARDRGGVDRAGRAT